MECSSGAAHGLSAILQVLLCVPSFVQSGHEQIIKQTVDFVLSLQQSNGNTAPAMDEIKHGGRPIDEELVHWCHGAPGKSVNFSPDFLIITPLIIGNGSTLTN